MVQPWAEMLAVALDAPVEVEGVSGPVDSSLANALVVYLEGASVGAVAVHLDKGSAARIVMRLLRETLLPRRSDPEQVRRAIAEYLAQIATRLLRRRAIGESVYARVAPPARRWDSAIRFRVHQGGEVCLEVLSCGARWEPGVLDEPTATPVRATVSLDEVQFELPLIVAVSYARVMEVERLAEEDVWLPESGWLLSPDRLSPLPDDVSSGQRSEGLLALPQGSAAALLVELRGASLHWTGILTSVQELGGGPHSDALPHWRQVQVTAGCVRLSFGEWSAIEPGSELAYEAADRWTLWVDGAPCALGVPCRWEGRWAVRVTRVVREVGSSEES